MKIHILATCRDFEIVKGTTLVFDTLRVGFPDAPVSVYLNGFSDERAKVAVQRACENVSAELFRVNTIHHEWIESLVKAETEPFIVLDTDIIFWQRCDGWKFDAPLAGRLIPQFYDGFTRAITRPRLHGSFLFIDPYKTLQAIEKYKGQFRLNQFCPMSNLFHPTCIPFDGKTYFHDTCCLLYQAIGGQAFTNEQLDCYDHLGSGTISDLVSPSVPEVGLRAAHFAIFENPSLAKGQWKNQSAHYAKHKA